MFNTAHKEWDDLTPEEQVAECEWTAEIFRRSRDAGGCASDVGREAAFWIRLAAEIRARL